MSLPKEIVDLIERFDRNREAYKSGQYNEMQLRQEFLDPFFEALGWDMTNKAGYAEAYKEVIHEDAIKIGSETKAPDYCFRIGGMRKFFLEAKKPSINLKEEISPAFQLRRYAWSAKLPLSILTDFEEFVIYDTRIKPEKIDKASTARISYFTYKDYAEKWDEIVSIFSRDAVLKGSFDKYAEKSRLKKGTATVDDAFLTEIEDWRDLLARNIAIRNSNLTQRELNFAVQRTIDRIVFLRICEDRGIEEYGRLQTQLNGTNVYKRLVQLFSQADDRYNSGLFHFQREKERHEEPDKLTPNITIDDKPLKDIIKRLYYPESPYEFSVLSADILGQVYEQFLGKVIRLTEGHQAKVEEKPEVRKAGGVYYTPKYIVDYIVKNTVGALLNNADGQTPLQSPLGKGGDRGVKALTPKEASKLRILDPACGSGSFLLGAYQYLLDWHRDWYVKDDPRKWATSKNPVLYEAQGGNWRLTTAEKKRILLNNIYGVDIDTQAVEVTKLSLLLKVLEGENNQTLANQLRIFHERALPDLGDNIKCGNSLIGPDFYQQQTMLDDEERYRVNVFDWEKEFPQVFTPSTQRGEGRGEGGFDAVIGNPPYIRIQIMKEWAPLEVEVYKELYQAGRSGNYDIYVVFVERGLSLLKKMGHLGFIVPNKFFNAQYGEGLRSIIAKGKHLAHVVHFGDKQIFTGATTYTCLLFLDKAGSPTCRFSRIDDLEVWKAAGEVTEAHIPATSITEKEWNFSAGATSTVIKRLQSIHTTLGDIAQIFVGLQTSADKIYVVPKKTDIESGLTKPFLLTGELKAYSPAMPSARLIFPYEVDGEHVEQITAETIKKNYPKGWAYLSRHKDDLMSREKGKWKNEKWYAYVYPKNLTKFQDTKLIVQVTAKRPTVLYDDAGLYMTGGGSGPFYGIRPKKNDLPIKYLLAILNSSLFGWLIKSQSTNLRGGYIKFSKQYIATAPIVLPSNAGHNNVEALSKLANQMLSLHKQLPVVKTDHEKTALQRQIDATDQQIDQLVYELYGLTEDEIKIVEGKAL